MTKGFAMGATGSSSTGKARTTTDFRPTPRDATIALLNHYAEVLKGRTIYELSCGDGAIVRTLWDWGFNVKYSDLYEQGHGDDLFGPPGFTRGGIDFLELTNADVPPGQVAIMNPPFKDWEAFARQCKALKFSFVAMFAKAQIWHSVNRGGRLWFDYPPTANHPLAWRVDFTGEGRSTMDTQWVVWSNEVPFSNQPFKRPEV